MIQAVHEHVRAVVERLGHAEAAAAADHGERLRRLVVEVPPAVWHKARTTAQTHYLALEERYGKPTAIAILSAGIVGCAVPVPCTTFLAMAPFLALAELHHQVASAGGPAGAAEAVKTHLAESEIAQHARQWMQELTSGLKRAQNP